MKFEVVGIDNKLQSYGKPEARCARPLNRGARYMCKGNGSGPLRWRSCDAVAKYNERNPGKGSYLPE